MRAKLSARLLAPLIGRWYRRRARAAARAGRWLEAARNYRRLADGRAATDRDLVQLGHALREAGKPSEALDAYQRAIEFNPLSMHAHLAMAHQLRRGGRSAEARDALARAWIADPAGVDLSVELGGRPNGTADWDRELQVALAGAVTACRQRCTWWRSKEGRLLRRARRAARRCDWSAAERHYASLLAEHPGYLPAQVQLGHMLVEQGRDDAALHRYRTALLLDPHYAEAHLHAGRALARLGRTAAARGALLAAWRLRPGGEAEAELAALDPDLTGDLLRLDTAGELLLPLAMANARSDLLPANELGPTATLFFRGLAGAVHAGR